MAISAEDEKLKELMKAAVAEVLDERRDFVRELVEEALEDIALARAIEEGEASAVVSREEVMGILEGGR
jgi:hypothetical protein